MNKFEMNRALYDKVFGDKDNVKATKIELLSGFLEHWAQDSVNKYDYGFKLPAKEIKTILEENNFQTTLRQLGYKLSLEGRGYGLAIFRHKKRNIIEFVNIHKLIKQFGVVIEAVFLTDDSFNYENKSYQVYGRFFYGENGKVFKEKGIYVTDGFLPIPESTIEYDTKEIPVMEFTNNSLASPDISKVSKDLIKQAEHFINKIPKEFEKGKIIFAFNNIINSTNTGEDFRRAVIEGGKDTYDLNDPDGAIANSMAPMAQGMSSIEMIERIYGFYESRARELSFQFRDHGKDSRKDKFDILQYNQKAFEYMVGKLNHRERQLQQFIDLLARVSKKKTGKIKLVMSEFEQDRINALKADTQLKMSTAKQAEGIAEKNRMEAETMRVAISEGNAKAVANTDAQQADVAKKQTGGEKPEVKVG